MDKLGRSQGWMILSGIFLAIQSCGLGGLFLTEMGMVALCAALLGSVGVALAGLWALCWLVRARREVGPTGAP
jgi:hypothetical protein